MGRKRIIIGQIEWGIHDQDAAEVAALVKAAMTTGVTVQLPLLDGADRQVTVYLNGNLTQCVVVDLDLGPRPTEISG